MSSAATPAGLPARKRPLLWIGIAAALGLLTGLLAPLAAVLVWPNQKPQATLKETRVQARVGTPVTLDASLSQVPNRPEARLRFEWSDGDDRLLLPAGVDPESAAARMLVVHGTEPGPREITLRVTNTSRCHRFTKLWAPAGQCEVSDEVRALLYFRPSECKPGPAMPADELVLDTARVIGDEQRDADCRLTLPKLIVTNGHPLEVRTDVPLEAAPEGSRIVAFRDAPANAAAGLAGADSANAPDGRRGADGGDGGPGAAGRQGRDAAAVVITAPMLLGQLVIENHGQAGGRGGVGGRGGQGGKGGNTVTASLNACDRLIAAEPGGKGGASGPGGPGGRGGKGGEVQVKLLHAVVPASRLTISAAGGAGGPGGPAGYPGRGGRGGFDIARASCPPGPDGPAGPDGQRGSSGAAGPVGAPAAIKVRDGATDRSPPPGQEVRVVLPNTR